MCWRGVWWTGRAFLSKALAIDVKPSDNLRFLQVKCQSPLDRLTPREGEIVARCLDVMHCRRQHFSLLAGHRLHGFHGRLVGFDHGLNVFASPRLAEEALTEHRAGLTQPLDLERLWRFAP